MCGIAGFRLNKNHHDPQRALHSMTSALAHRGPDSDGLWSDAENGIYFGHRRLAIQDLTETGQQPMSSASQRFMLVYNGELYNHLDLREQLQVAHDITSWRGTSDTETLLACFECWGIERTLQTINGMFAIALWDNNTRQLTLARDRLGEKPLYYANVDGAVVFGSELRAIAAFSDTSLTINRNAIGEHLGYSNVPAPFSIYENVFKMLPGAYITINANDAVDHKQQRYWQLADHAGSNAFSDDMPYEECFDLLKAQLEKSVQSRLLSDVPLGAFLSGGFDSSLVTAIMQNSGNGPTKTYSIGFDEDAHNEAPHAKRVANYLGTTHTEFYVGAQDAIDLVPKLGELWDEPFADSSQIPTYLVSALTKNEVTVALSGDGGDELFCGYSRYHNAQNIWNRLQRYPHFARSMFANISSAVKPAANLALPSPLKSKLRWLVEMRSLYRCASVDELYANMMMHIKDPSELVIGYTGHREAQPPRSAKPDNLLERMMLRDATHYLPNTILTKVDRASMAVSLETRAPLLDHELVELAWKIPMKYKYKDGEGKWILKQILYSYIPEELVNRPKMGFAVPIATWLRGSLKDWGEELLDVRKLSSQGYFNPNVVRRMWDEHQSGVWDWHYSLWDILMFQSWLEHQGALGSSVATEPRAA